VFVVDGCGGLALGFDEIEGGDDAEALAGEGDGAGVEFGITCAALGVALAFGAALLSARALASGRAVGRASTRLCWAAPSRVSALSRKTPSTHS
jgi:hypothetical protein